MKRALFFNLFVLLLIFSSHLSWSVEFEENGKMIIPDKVSGKIQIDGELMDPVWQKSPLEPEFKTIIPTLGQSLGLKTFIWAAYDKRSLYFAFKCMDPQEKKIKTSIAQRDKVGGDDMIGIMIDTLSTRQSSFEFYLNPNGIQIDGVNSSVSGTDITPDFIWESAGKLIPGGYQCEMRIPLESIRFKGGTKDIKMRIMFARSVPHLGAMGSWPAMEAGQTEYNFMANIVYSDLKSGLKLEVLPNFTSSWDSNRVTPDQWNKSNDSNIGIGIKYGITSSVTAEATFNPDFSHVESDVFQMEINRRYPLFYSEKRPFFMESKDVLDFTIIKDSMMIAPIHTRRIADPGWALKLSGSSGRTNFAFLAADDRSAGQPWVVGINPDEGKNALFGIFRAKYNLGSDNMLGVLYSGRHFAGQHNDVAGVDLKYRLSREIRTSLSYLQSFNRTSDTSPTSTGGGFNAMIEYNSPTLISWGIFERYDTDFLMETAFQNRTGISRGALGIGPIINVNSKALPWLKRIIPFSHYYWMYDLNTKMTDVYKEFAVNFGFAPIGEMNLEYWEEDEAWAGVMFEKKYFIGKFYIQLFKWLFLTAQTMQGDQIYYHPSAPFLGKGDTYEVLWSINPNMNLKVTFSYVYSRLREKLTHTEVYGGDIYNLATTYQFNKYFFLRGTLRYDNFQEKLLTDVLASFTLIPGTVVQLGYGALYQQNQWFDNRWIPGQGDLTQMKRGLFFKASYLWRLK